jgi:hypothetical protein
MRETLEASQIRYLIFKAKMQNGGVLAVARNVANLAHNLGWISAVPDMHYEHPLGEKILAVVWELILEGVYTPGNGLDQPNLPMLRVTEYGNKCFEAGELTPHDPDGYLARLKTDCPNLDDITLFYVGEALGTFRVSRFVPTTVMIGVAAESILLRLVDSVAAALDTPQKKQKFEQETKDKVAKRQHTEVVARLKAAMSAMPSDIRNVLAPHVDGIYDFIRRYRNDAGHPSGTKIERQECQALLLLFPAYCQTADRVIEWLKQNTI